MVGSKQLLISSACHPCIASVGEVSMQGNVRSPACLGASSLVPYSSALALVGSSPPPLCIFPDLVAPALVDSSPPPLRISPGSAAPLPSC